MRFAASLVLVTLTGFIALSYEIVWVRVYSFLSAGTARAFGLLLGAYLLGLAFGSLLSLRFRNDRDPEDPRQLGVVAGFVLAANLFGFLLAPAVSHLVTFVPYPFMLPLVAAGAALLGAVLPLLSHFGIPPDARAGQRLSWLYLANILGSAAGSLLTGFVLLDTMTLTGVTVLLAVLGIVVALGVRLFADRRPKAVGAAAGAAAALVIAVVLLAGPLFSGLWERLQLKGEYEPGVRFAEVLQSRHGVITLDRDGVVYGGGVFDGKLSTKLTPGSWIVRPYFLSAVRPAPKEVLEIGLSGGAWAQIMVHNPNIEKLTSIEIDPTYLKLIARHPEVRSLLENPKETIEIDDGRRWLVRHPDRNFDAIVMNTTYHWREFTSHLLSREFMELAKSHLKPGGIFLFNATGSRDAAKTAMEVFPHTMLVLNNVLASDRPLVPDRERWRKVLSEYRIDDRPVFDLATKKGRSDLAGVLALLDTLGVGEDLYDDYRLADRSQMEKLVERADAEVVTDDNMAVEF